MADQAFVEKATHRLAEAEVDVLRDYAEELMVNGAGERLRDYDPVRCGKPAEEVRAAEHRRFIGAAEVFGALRNERLRFSDTKGLPPKSEFVRVAFTDAAMAWLRYQRDDIRAMLDGARGTIEICEYEDGHGTSRDTFLLFVLDGIFAGEEQGRTDGDPKERGNGDGAPADIIALGNLIRAITADLDDEVDSRWASALNHMADRLDRSGIDAPEATEDIERVAIRSMSILSAHFANLLPDDSAWRKLFVELSESLLEDVEGPSLAALGGTPDQQTAPTDEDELFDNEEERAAIVAYTGLWQLRECRVRSETPALRAARLELRRRLDASEVGDRPTEGEEWTPVSGDKEQELLHEIHGVIRERLPQLDPMSAWGGPMRGIADSLGTTLGRHLSPEVTGDREAELGLGLPEIERLAGWIAFRVGKEFESIDYTNVEETLRAITEAARLGDRMRAIRGDIALRWQDRQAAVLIAKDELGKLDADPEGQKIAHAVITAWDTDSDRQAETDA